MTAQVVRVTDDTTRAELAETLGHLTAHAKRQQRIVARFRNDAPTTWDRAHASIDAVLEDWLRARV